MSQMSQISSASEMLEHHTRHKVWAIGGGKGGVGKSLITANASICLALMGHKVVTIDLDLGGANLHTCLGVSIPPKTLSDYLGRRVSSLKDIMTQTPIKNLSIISGAQDELGMANLKQMHKSKLLSRLNEIDADYILLDLGAGTTANTLDFFISSEQGILTVLPEPTSIENSYRFIKSVFYRRLKAAPELEEIGPLIDQTMNAKVQDSAKSPRHLLERVGQRAPHLSSRLEEVLSGLRLKLIMNQVRTQADIDIGFSMQTICKKYFGLQVDYIGYLDYDPSVWQSVKKRKPLLIEFPNSQLVGNFDRIVGRLLDVS